MIETKHSISTPTFRFLGWQKLSGQDNMALDAALQECVEKGISPPTLRLYQWSRMTLSLGYRQKIQEDLNLLNCRQAAVDVVRRITGGSGVLHGWDITYSLIVRKSPSFNRKKVYLTVNRAWVKVLSNLGIEATLANENSDPVRGFDCFEKPIQYEVISSDQKIIGSAQREGTQSILQHGSYQLRNCSQLLSYFEVSATPYDGEPLQPEEPEFSTEILAALLLEELSRELRVTWTYSDLTEDEEAEWERQKENYYSWKENWISFDSTNIASHNAS